MSDIAFIGLGVMGYPMAGHLSTAGHKVTVFNRTASRARQWLADYRGHSEDTVHAAVSGADVVITCVGDDEDLRAVVGGEYGALKAMNAGSLLIDHTTASAIVAREINAAAAAGNIEFVDAPVSGGEAGAVNGALTVMCGGSAEAFARAQPVIDSYARASTLMGDCGCGQLTKMVNQLCVAGVIQGLAEGLYFGERAGLDMTRVLAVISQGAAQSWQLDNRGETMCEGRYDFGFAVDWMRKDLAIVRDEAARLGFRLPASEAIDERYAQVQAMGGQRWDTSSLIECLRNSAR